VNGASSEPAPEAGFDGCRVGATHQRKALAFGGCTHPTRTASDLFCDRLSLWPTVFDLSRGAHSHGSWVCSSDAPTFLTGASFHDDPIERLERSHAVERPLPHHGEARRRWDGSVYRALDKNLEADVVIKIPRPSMMDDPEFAARFTREVRSLVRLSHPHIVKVTDVGTWEATPSP